MPRIHCLRCHYPVNTCVCQAIAEVSCSTKIVIMQHPSETSHAKNTARLVPLAIGSAEIVVGETADDFQGLSERYRGKQNVAVFYPAPASSEFAPRASSQTIETLLFLDGTWRKALKLWSLNPWLSTLPTYKISPEAPSNYGIRKTKQRHGLSTLEAVSHALQLNENINITPLLNLQQAMQAHWLDSNHRTKTRLK